MSDPAALALNIVDMGRQITGQPGIVRLNLQEAGADDSVQGTVIREALPGNPHAHRTVYLEAYLNPDSIRDRHGSFSSGLRNEQFNLLGATGEDEAGHILANTLGGPNTVMNFFPQHRAVNRNFGVRPLVDNWYSTENHIRSFLNNEWGQWGADRYVRYIVYLEYPGQTGRPSALTFVALFHSTDGIVGTHEDHTRTCEHVYSMWGRVNNDGRNGFSCPRRLGNGRRLDHHGRQLQENPQASPELEGLSESEKITAQKCVIM
ncbi:DNA/RNA non-specific endonuclease domain-containing protein [Ditylenchus destructor]|nr:DNA/RNA non-specific endonuclease domain-containing protein [Ditylenchus destructor]